MYQVSIGRLAEPGIAPDSKSEVILARDAEVQILHLPPKTGTMDELTRICHQYSKRKTELEDPQGDIRLQAEALGISVDDLAAEMKFAAEAAIKSVQREMVNPQHDR